MSKATIEQQASAARHALSIIKRTQGMGEPALTWLEAAVETLAFIERQPEFARALAMVLSALPGMEVVAVRETGHERDGTGGERAVRAGRDASE